MDILCSICAKFCRNVTLA